MNSPFSSPMPQRSASPSVMSKTSALFFTVALSPTSIFGRMGSGRFISGKDGFRVLWISITFVLPPSSSLENQPAPLPHITSTITVKPASLIFCRSTSFWRFSKYASEASKIMIFLSRSPSLSSRCFTSPAEAGISASILFNPSGSIALPFSSRTLNPLSVGGLWEAVMLTAPQAFLFTTAYAMVGVGVGPSVRYTFRPLPAKTSAADAAKFSEWKRLSYPTTTH